MRFFTQNRMFSHGIWALLLLAMMGSYASAAAPSIPEPGTPRMMPPPPHLGYLVEPVRIPCSQTTFDMCLSTADTIATGMWGLGYCLEYDTNAVRPTGNYTLGGIVTNPGGFTAVVDTSQSGRVYTAIYLSGGQVSYMTGPGQVICIEFELITNAVANYSFPVCDITESFDPNVSAVVSGNPPAVPGNLIVDPDNSISVDLIYQNDTARPVGYQNGFPPTIGFSAENLFGTCLITGQTASPDSLGQLRFPPLGGFNIDALQLFRDIPNANPVMNVINGADGMRVFSIWNGSYPSPNIYELISADADGDGRILVGDMSAINARSVLARSEFFGVPDWYFVNDTLLASTAYTTADKNNVPRPPDCFQLTRDTSGGCISNVPETYHGILVGDVDGNWSTADMGTLKTTSTQRFEVRLDQAVSLGNNQYRIPVYGFTDGPTQGLDLDIDFDESRLSIKDVVPAQTLAGNATFFTWNTPQQERLFVTTGIQQGWFDVAPLLYLEVEATQLPMEADFGLLKGYMGGQSVPVLTPATTGTGSWTVLPELEVFPNPSEGQLVIRCEGIHQPTPGYLFNALGQQVGVIELTSAATRMDLSQLPVGVYSLQVDGFAVKKVVKQ